MRIRFGLNGIAALILGAALHLATATPARAQFFTDEFGGQGTEFTDADEAFAEDTGQPGEPGAPTTRDDFTSGGEYVEESRIAPGGQTVTESGRRTQLRLAGDKEMLPFNAAWGGGTGLLIGGWFALIQNGDNRSTLRSVGLGTVLGTVIGIAVGMKTLITPGAPVALSLYDPGSPPPADDRRALGSLVASNAPPQLSIGLKFSF
ncbi:MAG: hypothetical protein HY423_15570 [Candidatus Lambdaproteobacteria bacterium]|nr:hypothetical protein [Candidatus Lambdaproteobacteria bacterium]